MTRQNSSSISKPFLLKPASKDYLWGGNRLNDEFAKNIDSSPLAETWECSTHPDGVSIVSSGVFEGTGLDKLEADIRQKFYEGKVTLNDQVYITNARHKECLDSAYKSLNNVLDSVSKDLPEDFYSIDLMDAYEKLGLIIGESVEDDLANEIFSKFCMGK